jgi:diaminohydroxyphosphoribosylaminopyrimidine deaminase/5-amino-6-(5-phosphoribosylamino)uracil reductase
MTKSDERYMELALAEARKGEFQTWPNPWVGAVLVKGGKVVGRGWHRGAGLPHAEIEALRSAGTKARGATLYVTLEPCAHYGRTSPCAVAVLEAGIRRVVGACPDPNPKAQGGFAFLKRHKVEVTEGVLAAEAENLNRYFMHSVRTGRPWVTLKSAASLDGRTATSRGESKWITSAEARADARTLRGRCDAILVGAGTVTADEPTLMPEPKAGFLPWRLVLDPKGGLRGDESVFRDEWASRTVWFAGVGAFKRALDASRRTGVQAQALRPGDLAAAVRAAMEWMRVNEIRRVMVEGGAATLGAFLGQGYGDEMVMYFAPRLEGSGRGRGMFDFPRERSLKEWPRLRLDEVASVGPDLRLHGIFDRS